MTNIHVWISFPATLPQHGSLAVSTQGRLQAIVLGKSGLETRLHGWWWACTVVSRVSAHGCLEFTGQISGVGAHTEKPSVRISYIHVNRRIVNNGGWVLTRRWVLTWDTTIQVLSLPTPSHQVTSLDEAYLRQFSQTAAGCLPPLTTALGGVVAQEALVALTGKFSPIQQWVSFVVFYTDSYGIRCIV